MVFWVRSDLNLTAIGEHKISIAQSSLPFFIVGCKGSEACCKAKIPAKHGMTMKKPKLEADEPQSRKIIRADKAPTDGYSLVVDGHFKSHHDTVEAAEEAGMALKNRYQMLQVQVYDAVTKTRSMIEWPAPAA